jgi:hypothetical protein
MYNKMTTTL